ncbi:hypothetical protein HPULCUR_003370 [Helicostylum pulchrum]|uniref:PiggyBac transposable element-derived protein domain-containing protein n=1 Tax=Helicostylum pulchrum TaxID=562976 RepID=A0ABP9XT60_9FUNG
MPKINSLIAVGARISVSKQFLTRTEVPTLLKDKFDFSTPGLRLPGVIVGSITGANGDVMWQIVFDDLPDRNFSFPGTTIKYEGPRRHTRPAAEDSGSSDSDNEEEEIIDTTSPAVSDDWRMDHVTIDARNISQSYKSLTSKFNLSNESTASPEDHFPFFLPMDHIRDVVIPNINTYASTVIHNWINITFTEYLTWMTLITMTNNADPLYQIRGFLAAFNETLSKTLEPSNYLCVDESMNQWLGNGMPNLKKVPRKSHPIGQEFKTLADNHTYYILQLDTVSGKVRKEFDDVDRNLIATIKRLCKPWFASGRTIIADS